MILVTGGTGLLGSNLLIELCKVNNSICAIYRDDKKINLVKKLFQKLEPKNYQSLFDKIEWIECDILDLVKLYEVVANVDYIYHCAAFVSFRKTDFAKMMKINAQGTANVVNCALDNQIKKLAFVSSTAAVGKVRKDNIYFVEESNKWTQNKETSGYAISKYTAEKEVWRGIEEGLNAIIINPSVILGPGNWNESSLTIFKTLSNGLKFYTKGSNAFVDVRDVVSAFMQLMNSDIHSQRFLCTGSNSSFKSLFDLIANKLKIKAPYIYANSFLSGIAWRLSVFVSLFSKNSTLTRESAQSAQSKVEYSSEKICDTLNLQFHSLKETIHYAIDNRIE